MAELSTLPLGCPFCGHTSALTVEGWTPETQVESHHDCPACGKAIFLELPGHVVSAKGQTPRPPLTEDTAAKLFGIAEQRLRQLAADVTSLAEHSEHVDADIARIRRWQANGRVHPLTCGNDSSHAKLEPIAEDGRVILVCPDCDYRQDVIPSIVLED
jgi:hypothetical protein